MPPKQPSLREIRRIFQRHPGQQKRMAIELGVSEAAVSLVIKGKSKSAAIRAALAARAQELSGPEPNFGKAGA